MAFAPLIILALSAASAGVAAYGAYQQGQEAKKAAGFNAAVAQQNAQLNIDEAKQEAAQQQRQTILRLGSIRAAAGASGIQQEGNVLDVLGETARQSELERQNIVYHGALRARAETDTAIGEVFRGAGAARAGALRAGATLLGGAADASSNYSDAKAAAAAAKGQGGRRV